jgi:hypothetical protein
VSDTYVFVKLTDYDTGEPVAVRIDQIVAVRGRPKRAGIERDIAFMKARIAQCEAEGVSYDLPRMIDVEDDKAQLATLERRRGEKHGGTLMRLVEDVEGDGLIVAEPPVVVMDRMAQAMRGATS